MTQEEVIRVCEYYCGNNNKELKRIITKKIASYGIVSPQDMNYDDYISLAQEVLYSSAISFDGEKNDSFEGYLVSCLFNRFSTMQRDQTRGKRCQYEEVIDEETGKVLRKKIADRRLNQPIDELGEAEYGDTIKSDFNLEESVIDSMESRAKQYLSKLSKKQKQLVSLLMDGYKPSAIKEIMGIDDAKYTEYLKFLRKDENTAILTCHDIVEKKENNSFIPINKMTSVSNEKDKECIEMSPSATVTSMEKNKKTVYQARDIIKKIKSGAIQTNHPLQREADQHTRLMKSNLVSDMIQGNPVPELICAEEIIPKDNRAVTWLIDGKQRATTAKQFMDNLFSISNKTTRYLIKYFEQDYDEEGEPIFDEDGIYTGKWVEFDIRNKKFKDLPKELQENFLSFNFEVNLYMNCSGEEIGYHINRYNQGKAMSKADKGILGIGEKFARRIKEISNMEFFKGNDFSYKESNNGTLNRVCMEAIMATHFFNDWKKSPEDIGKYLQGNMKTSHLDELEDSISRLQSVLVDNEEVGEEIFNSKETFIWLTVFDKFKKLNLDDGRFLDFMSEWVNKLSTSEINGKTYESLEQNEEGKRIGSKDKNVVLSKVRFIHTLMMNFLGLGNEKVDTSDNEIINDSVENNAIENIVSGNTINIEETRSEVSNNNDYSDSDEIDYWNLDSSENATVQTNDSIDKLHKSENLSEAMNICKEFISKDIELEDVELYRDMFDDYSVELDSKSPLLVSTNRPSLIAMVGYICSSMYDDDDLAIEFFKKFFSKNSISLSNQRDNFQFMKNEFTEFAAFY